MKLFAEITTVLNKYTNLFFSKCCGRTRTESVSRITDEKFGFFAGSGNNDENKIVMTTHSLCVLSFITLAAKSYELMNKGVKCNLARKNKTNGNRNAAK